MPGGGCECVEGGRGEGECVEGAVEVVYNRESVC